MKESTQQILEFISEPSLLSDRPTQSSPRKFPHRIMGGDDIKIHAKIHGYIPTHSLLSVFGVLLACIAYIASIFHNDSFLLFSSMITLAVFFFCKGQFSVFRLNYGLTQFITIPINQLRPGTIIDGAVIAE